MAEITGPQVFAVTAGVFAVIIGENLVLADKAVSPFPGLEVGNSYGASQELEARRTAQEALGWQVAPRYGDGMLEIAITDPQDRPARMERFAAMVGRTTERQHGLEPEFAYDGKRFVAPVELARDRWETRVKARAADGTQFEQRLILSVRG